MIRTLKNPYLVLLILLSAAALLSCLKFYKKKERDLLIIGCARSGTTYITKVLQNCGYKIGHEHFKHDGACSWEMVVDTKKVPWGKGRNGRRFGHIFHQVRQPLKVISSLYATEPPKSWKFILKHIPEIHENDTHLVKCAKYWYYWNLKAEKQAEWTYRIEDIDLIWSEFERRCERKLDRTEFPSIPRDVNTRGPHRDFTWEDLQRELDPDFFLKIQDLAQRYGY